MMTSMMRRPRSQERPASEKEDSDEESNEATEDSEAEETVGEMMFDDQMVVFDQYLTHSPITWGR